jgi:hypothetical protein
MTSAEPAVAARSRAPGGRVPPAREHVLGADGRSVPERSPLPECEAPGAAVLLGCPASCEPRTACTQAIHLHEGLVQVAKSDPLRGRGWDRNVSRLDPAGRMNVEQAASHHARPQLARRRGDGSGRWTRPGRAGGGQDGNPGGHGKEPEKGGAIGHVENVHRQARARVGCTGRRPVGTARRQVHRGNGRKHDAGSTFRVQIQRPAREPAYIRLIPPRGIEPLSPG